MNRLAMTDFNIERLSGFGLNLRYLITRLNPISALAVLLFTVGVLSLAVWWPIQKSAVDSKQEILTQLIKKSLNASNTSAIPLTLNEMRQNHVYEMLGEAGYEEQQLKTFFDLAAKNNLKLTQGEYKATYDRSNNITQYQVQFPVVGTYPAIRQFCEQVLLSLPFASLDEINFKREAINNGAPEARLKFTLFLTTHPKTAEVRS